MHLMKKTETGKFYDNINRGRDTQGVGVGGTKTLAVWTVSKALEGAR